MDNERVKLIIRNMELLLDALKKEFEDPIDEKYKEISSYVGDEDVEYYEEEY